MQQLKEYKVKFTIDDNQISGTQKKINDLNDSIKDTAKSTDKLDDSVKKSNKSLNETKGTTSELSNIYSKLGPAIAGAFTVGAVVQFGKAVFEATARQENFNVALTTMLKSKEQADILGAKLVTLASKSPFDLSQLQDATKQLIAFGFGASEIQQTLIKLGDISSGIGAPLQDIAYLFGTIRTQGRAMTVDINQFANRGIPIWEQLAEITGKNGMELRKYVEEGKVGFSEIEQAFTNLTKEGGTFYNLMNEQSNTLGGQLSNLGDNWNEFLVALGGSGGIFKNVISGLSAILEYANAVVTSQTKKIEQESSESADAMVRKTEDYKKYIEELSVSQNKTQEETYKSEQERLSQNLKESKQKLQDFKKDIERNGLILNQSIGEEHLTTSGETGEKVADVLKRLQTSVYLYSSAISNLTEAKKQYNKELQSEIEKQKVIAQARLKATENAFKEELRVLKIQEESKTKLAENSLEKVAIEDEYNYKRLAIYEKYNDILKKDDLETKQSLIDNIEYLNNKTVEVQKDFQAKNLEDMKKYYETRNAQELESIANHNRGIEKANQEKLDTIKQDEFEALTEIEKTTFKKEEDKQKAIFEIEKEYAILRLQWEQKFLQDKLNNNVLNTDEIISLKKQIAEKEYEIEKTKNSKIASEDKKLLKDKKQNMSDYSAFFQQAIQTLSTIQYENQKAELVNQQNKLDREREIELSNKNLTESEKEVIQQKYDEKERQLKRRQAELDKQKAITDIVINTAVAITSALKNPATAPYLVPLITALGLVQLNAVKSRPLPAYFDGTDYLPLNGNKKGRDTIPIMAHEGERIVPTAINEQLKGIKNAELPELVKLGLSLKKGSITLPQNNNNVIVNLDNKELLNAFKNQPKLSINMDEKGIQKYWNEQGKKQQLKNQRYGI